MCGVRAEAYGYFNAYGNAARKDEHDYVVSVPAAFLLTTRISVQW